MSVAVRVAETDAEREEWRAVRLVVEPGERTAPVEELRERDRRTPGRAYLLADVDGELAGSGFSGRSDLGHAGLMILVLPERRGRGAGSALLEALLGNAIAQGYARAGVHVDGADERSLAFARRHDFDEVDRQVEMVRVLDGQVPGPRPFDGAFFYLALPLRVARESRAFRPDAIVAESAYSALGAFGGRALAESRPAVVVVRPDRPEWLRNGPPGGRAAR